MVNLRFHAMRTDNTAQVCAVSVLVATSLHQLSACCQSALTRSRGLHMCVHVFGCVHNALASFSGLYV